MAFLAFLFPKWGAPWAATKSIKCQAFFERVTYGSGRMSGCISERNSDKMSDGESEFMIIYLSQHIECQNTSQNLWHRSKQSFSACPSSLLLCSAFLLLFLRSCFCWWCFVCFFCRFHCYLLVQNLGRCSHNINFNINIIIIIIIVIIIIIIIIVNMGVSINGDTPIARWFSSWIITINWTNDDHAGTPMT